jgi:uncharacterized repeat protein (TIGR01451 family)
LDNTATVTPPAGVTDTNPANNSATDTDTLTPQADLSITKTDGETSVVPGTTTTYTIVVSNLGPNAVSGASVSDPLPAGVTTASWTASTSSSGGHVTGPSSGTGSLASTVDLPVGATVTFTFTVQVDPSATGTLDNTATVTPPADVADPNPANNGATDTDTLTPQADLAVMKSVSDSAPSVGNTITFTITLTDNGPSSATGVQVSDLLPAGLTFVSANLSQGTYDPATGLWNVGPVANGAHRTLTVQALAASPGTETNSATISHADQFDPDTGNDTSTVSILVTPSSPPVTVVSLKRFGYHHERTLLVVGFSGPLDPSSAQDLSNYSLILIAHGGRLRLPRSIENATYNPVAETVTLHPTRLLPLRFHYKLTVNASTPTGVRDASGRLLDGDGDGIPGGDFVRVFGRHILAGKNPRFVRHGVHVSRQTLLHPLFAPLSNKSNGARDTRRIRLDGDRNGISVVHVVQEPDRNILGRGNPQPTPHRVLLSRPTLRRGLPALTAISSRHLQ